MPARNTNRFEEALIEQQALLSVEPIDSDLLHVTLGSLESTGYELVGQGHLKTARFAEAMHVVFTNVADLEVEPPLNEAQMARIAGKVATYSAMCEATAPKPSRRTQKKTDTDKTPTDKSKK